MEERICRNCSSEEVEDIGHVVLRCTHVAERGRMERLMSEMLEGWQSVENNEMAVAVLDRACKDE